MARSNKRKPVSDINVVPYIDVMLVLLIVFMVTAPLLTQGVSVELPEAPSKPLEVKEEQETLVVTVAADGSYYIDLGDEPRKAVALQHIGSQVSKVIQVQPKTSVLIRGDRSVNYGVVVELMTVLQQAGVPNVGLISEPPAEQGK